MKFSWGSSPLRSAGLGALFGASSALASLAQAAAVDVRVTDVAGRALPLAVVMLEPATGKLPVAPMTGVEIAQAKRQFTPQVTVITVGTKVAFPNFDTVRHHVYSFSPAKHFELKLYAGTPTAPVTFDQPGIAVIGCNIHDSMVGWVVVVDTPLYAVTASAGRVHLPAVPRGQYRLKAWHAGMPSGQPPESRTIDVASDDVEQSVKLAVPGDRAMKSPLSAPFVFAARWLRGSIGARVIAMFLGLLLIVQIASFTALQASLTRHAHNVLPDKLMVGGRVLQSLLDRQSQTLIEGARLLAADYGFREAVSSNDSDTIVSVLANHGARIGATQAALVTTSFELRAATGHDSADLAGLVSRLAAGALANGRASQVALLAGRPHQVVMVPIKAPLTVGWVLMGVPLDMRLAADMQSLSALNVTLLARPAASDDWTASLSSLPTKEAAALAKLPWGAMRGNGKDVATTSTVSVQDEELGVHPMWLNSADTASSGGAVLAVVSLSVDEAVRLPRDLQLALLAVTLLGFAAFSLFGVLTAGRVTTPLRRLSAAADRLGGGDYSTPVTTGVRRNDEIGHLAQAFEQMRMSVADKQAQILKLAYWDSLTALPNRVQFRDAVHEAIREAEQLGEQGTVSVIMLDLDRFKHVNDVLGYRFGDLVLMRVAERLSQQSVRGADLVARLGGDEFAVLLRNGDLALAQAVAKRIERAFDAPLSLEEHMVDMGAGIGLACWPTHATDADTLLSRAEVAMYSAKRRTSGPLVYDPSIDLSSAQTLSLMSELRLAVGEGQLRLYLQPKLALDSGKVMGAETLVRWQHPVRGLVPPMQFIPFAEQTGFIRTITMWVFEEAARHWRLLHSEGLRITLSVNLSTRDLLDPELPQKFDALLVKHRVPAEAFCLEITESAIMDDPQRAQATLDRLSALGFKLSIDDFGTGYSSLAYLKRLPVDELKIDKSFVLSMENDADDAKIVRSTIDLAHNLGLSVVAEGVENGKVWDMLRDLNCDQAQGFHMGRPMEASDFASWSTSWVARQRAQDGESRTMLH